MSDQTDSLVSLVKPYGLSAEESKVYIHLLTQGSASALAISRELKMGRTKIYRLLDKLKEKQLIEYQIQERGLKFAASHPAKFEQLLASREQEVQTLKKSLPNLISHLTPALSPNLNDSKIVYYEGIEGLKQVSYNIIRAKEILRVFEMEHLSDFLPVDFSEEIRTKLVENRIYTRDLTNKSSFEGFTDVAKLIEDYSHFRYIDPSKLQIEFEVVIYNDVYATYSYKNEKIFCVEIYNSQLADMQKQIFDFIWDHAEPMKFTDKRGGARVEED